MNAFAAERTRKAVHVALGSATLTFPWIFHSARPVLVLAVIATAVLLSVRLVPALRAGAGRALYGVARRSYGEFAFVAGVALTFVLARGDIASYVIPVAVLTFADTAAALIGTRFGWHRYTTPSGRKSVEGSIAFFCIAMICIATPLGLAGHAHAFAIAAIVSTALMLIEASAWDGLDNIMIPLTGGLLLRAFASGFGGAV